jgi:elongation factor Tu
LSFASGTVITGRAERGKLKVGQDIELVGYNKSVKSKVTGIEMFHKILEEANAGDQMGILVRGLKRDDVRRGMCAVKPGSVKQHDSVKAQIYLMTKEEGGSARPLLHEKIVLCFSKTWDCATFVELENNKDMVMPGEDSTITLKFIHPMVIEKNQTFTLRDGAGTVGTGKVTMLNKNMTDVEKEYIAASKKKKEKMKAAKVV